MAPPDWHPFEPPCGDKPEVYPGRGDVPSWTLADKYPWNLTSSRRPYKFCRVQPDLANRPAVMGVVHASWPLAVPGYRANPYGTCSLVYELSGSRCDAEVDETVAHGGLADLEVVGEKPYEPFWGVLVGAKDPLH